MDRGAANRSSTENANNNTAAAAVGKISKPLFSLTNPQKLREGDIVKIDSIAGWYDRRLPFLRQLQQQYAEPLLRDWRNTSNSIKNSAAGSMGGSRHASRPTTPAAQETSSATAGGGAGAGTQQHQLDVAAASAMQISPSVAEILLDGNTNTTGTTVGMMSQLPPLLVGTVCWINTHPLKDGLTDPDSGICYVWVTHYRRRLTQYGVYGAGLVPMEKPGLVVYLLGNVTSVGKVVGLRAFTQADATCAVRLPEENSRNTSSDSLQQGVTLVEQVKKAEAAAEGGVAAALRNEDRAVQQVFASPLLSSSSSPPTPQLSNTTRRSGTTDSNQRRHAVKLLHSWRNGSCFHDFAWVCEVHGQEGQQQKCVVRNEILIEMIASTLAGTIQGGGGGAAAGEGVGATTHGSSQSSKESSSSSSSQRSESTSLMILEDTSPQRDNEVQQHKNTRDSRNIFSSSSSSSSSSERSSDDDGDSVSDIVSVADDHEEERNPDAHLEAKIDKSKRQKRERDTAQELPQQLPVHLPGTGIHPCPHVMVPCTKAPTTGQCLWAKFPLDSCLEFLKTGHCSEEDEEGATGGCVKRHYDRFDQKYMPKHPCLYPSPVLEVSPATNPSSPDLFECGKGAHCPWLHFPGFACTKFLQLQCQEEAQKPSMRKDEVCANMENHFSIDDERFQNESIHPCVRGAGSCSFGNTCPFARYPRESCLQQLAKATCPQKQAGSCPWRHVSYQGNEKGENWNPLVPALCHQLDRVPLEQQRKGPPPAGEPLPELPKPTPPAPPPKPMEEATTSQRRRDVSTEKERHKDLSSKSIQPTLPPPQMQKPTTTPGAAQLLLQQQQPANPHIPPPVAAAATTTSPTKLVSLASLLPPQPSTTLLSSALAPEQAPLVTTAAAGPPLAVQPPPPSTHPAVQQAPPPPPTAFPITLPGGGGLVMQIPQQQQPAHLQPQPLQQLQQPQQPLQYLPTSLLQQQQPQPPQSAYPLLHSPQHQHYQQQPMVSPLAVQLQMQLQQQQLSPLRAPQLQQQQSPLAQQPPQPLHLRQPALAAPAGIAPTPQPPVQPPMAPPPPQDQSPARHSDMSDGGGGGVAGGGEGDRKVQYLLALNQNEFVDKFGFCLGEGKEKDLHSAVAVASHTLETYGVPPPLQVWGAMMNPRQPQEGVMMWPSSRNHVDF